MTAKLMFETVGAAEVGDRWSHSCCCWPFEKPKLKVTEEAVMVSFWGGKIPLPASFPPPDSLSP